MKKEQKKETIDALTVEFEKYPSFYLTDASKLTVAQVNKLRCICHRDGVKMKVAKNTLIQKALEAKGSNYSELFGALKGETAIMFSEVANAPAKIIKEFRKDNEKPLLKAAYIESSIYLGEKSLNELAKLKSKQELLGEIVGLLQSPMSNLVSALYSGKSTISGIVKTLSERK
jgi:large subunit ribosomal protein L10